MFLQHYQTRRRSQLGRYCIGLRGGTHRKQSLIAKNSGAFKKWGGKSCKSSINRTISEVNHPIACPSVKIGEKDPSNRRKNCCQGRKEDSKIWGIGKTYCSQEHPKFPKEWLPPCQIEHSRYLPVRRRGTVWWENGLEEIHRFSLW